MIQGYLEALRNHVRDPFPQEPFMVTYTTLLSKRLKAKFTLLRYWKKFVFEGISKLPFRESYASPVCWSIEESESSVHVHALYSSWVALRTHQTLWNTIHLHDLGRCYVTTGGSWDEYIEYIHKSFDHISRFFGHYVTFENKLFKAMLK